MQKRHLIVGLVMFVASVVSYGYVHMTAASPAIEVVDTATPSVGVTAAASPLVFPAAALEVSEALVSLPDSGILFAAGVALMGLAAGIRRHVS
jgi:drug/metabolite transporter (DMT)-like permease